MGDTVNLSTSGYLGTGAIGYSLGTSSDLVGCTLTDNGDGTATLTETEAGSCVVSACRVQPRESGTGSRKLATGT